MIENKYLRLRKVKSVFYSFLQRQCGFLSFLQYFLMF